MVDNLDRVAPRMADDACAHLVTEADLFAIEHGHTALAVRGGVIPHPGNRAVAKRPEDRDRHQAALAGGVAVAEELLPYVVRIQLVDGCVLLELV